MKNRSRPCLYSLAPCNKAAFKTVRLKKQRDCTRWLTKPGHFTPSKVTDNPFGISGARNVTFIPMGGPARPMGTHNPCRGILSEMGIYRQPWFVDAANFVAFIDLPYPQS